MTMRIISTLSDYANQSVSFVTRKSEKVTLNLRFNPSQETWYIDVISDSLTIYNLALMASLNLLEPYHDKISWGLYVNSLDGFDPWRVDDFSTRRILLCITEGFEKALIEEQLNGNLLR